MGRPTVIGVGSQMGAGKSATTYVSTIPSANQAVNGKLKKSCCAPQTATGTTSLTSDNSGNDHQGTGNGVGGYLKKTFKKKLLKARNPRAADLQAYASSGDAQIHTHVNPLSPEASTLLQMIHGCDWALVREHLSTKKGAHEFHKALEYDETSQAMSLDLNTGASVTSESIDGSMHALREPEVISTFVPAPQPMKSRYLKKKHSSGSEYVSPGTVSQSNFGAVKKVTATQSIKQQQSRPESAVNSGPVSNNNNDDSAHSGTVDEDLEDEDNFDDDGLLRTSTASVSSSLRVDNAVRSSLQGSVVLNGAEGGGGGGNSSVRSGGSGSKSSHKGGKIKTISCTPTLLHLLCTLNPPVQMVQRVLSQKPSFAQAMNNLEQTPLHLCCVYGASPQVIQCLLKHNKRLATLLDHRGRTALHLLCEVGIRKEQEEIMSGRIGSSRSGYDSSDNDDDLEDEEETPVKECMEFLLWAYPDAVLLVDSEKKIPLDYAVAAKAHPKWILQLQKIQNSRYEMLNGKSNNKLHSEEEA